MSKKKEFVRKSTDPDTREKMYVGIDEDDLTPGMPEIGLFRGVIILLIFLLIIVIF